MVKLQNRYCRRAGERLYFASTMHKFFFASALILLLSSAAQAGPTWVWLDENGRRVASDMPPPATVPDQRILRRPAAPASATAPSAAPAAPAATATPARPAPAGGTAAGRLTDEQLRQQVEQRNAQIRADNCQRARASLESLQAGASQPLYMVNEQGQRVTLDEAMKRAESVRLRQIVRDNCAPPAAANQAGAGAGAAAPAGAPATSPAPTPPRP
jgi:hypothetical protein